MAVRVSKNISLTPALEAFVDSQVASGQYQTVSEVVRAALRLLQAQAAPEQRQPMPSKSVEPVRNAR
jgi:putative addiction module CopG family antidote